MRIRKVLLEEKIEEKIFKKHGVSRAGIEQGLFNGSPLLYRTGKGSYAAITLKEMHITIIFRYEKDAAHIITAYPSSKWQTRLYKRKRK